MNLYIFTLFMLERLLWWPLFLCYRIVSWWTTSSRKLTACCPKTPPTRETACSTLHSSLKVPLTRTQPASNAAKGWTELSKNHDAIVWSAERSIVAVSIENKHGLPIPCIATWGESQTVPRTGPGITFSVLSATKAVGSLWGNLGHQTCTLNSNGRHRDGMARDTNSTPMLNIDTAEWGARQEENCMKNVVKSGLKWWVLSSTVARFVLVILYVPRSMLNQSKHMKRLG